MTRPKTPDPDTPALVARALRVCNLLRDWPGPVLAQIAATARLKQYPKGAQVWAQKRQQRDVIAIVSGSLQISGVNSAGAKFVLSILGAGEIVGLVRLLDGFELVYDYHAHEDTLLLHIPAARLRGLLDAHPALWKSVALLALARQQDSIATLQRRSFRSIKQNFAEALLRLAHTGGRPAGPGTSVTLRVSQTDLAAMAAVSRQTVNKHVQHLAKLGILQTAYGELTILDLPALQALAHTGELERGDGVG